MDLKFGIYLNGISLSYEDLKHRWQAADTLGFDYIWMMDNVVGPVPYLASDPVMDTWTVLPALAEATSRAKFGTLVTPYGRRMPAVVAKSATILDHVSNGRFNLGMGPGDEERQHVPWGQPYPKPSERIAQLREELTIIKKMFVEEEATFAGKYHTVTKAVNSPKSIQKPHPPIWIGLIFGKQLMPKIAGEFADGINFYHADDNHVREMIGIAKQRVEEFGRDFETVMMSRNIGLTISDEPVDWDEFIKAAADAARVTVESMRDYYATYECHAAGTVEHIAREIVAHTIELGIEQPIVHLGKGLGGNESSNSEIQEEMEVFMTEIVPLVRELAADKERA